MSEITSPNFKGIVTLPKSPTTPHKRLRLNLIPGVIVLFISGDIKPDAAPLCENSRHSKELDEVSDIKYGCVSWKAKG